MCIWDIIALYVEHHLHCPVGGCAGCWVSGRECARGRGVVKQSLGSLPQHRCFCPFCTEDIYCLFSWLQSQASSRSWCSLMRFYLLFLSNFVLSLRYLVWWHLLAGCMGMKKELLITFTTASAGHLQIKHPWVVQKLLSFCWNSDQIWDVSPISS